MSSCNPQNKDLPQRMRRFHNAAQKVINDRHPKYGESWKSEGILGVALQLINCLRRTKSMTWDKHDVEELPAAGDLLNLAVDVSNYAAMLWLLVDEEYDDPEIWDGVERASTT